MKLVRNLLIHFNRHSTGLRNGRSVNKYFNYLPVYGTASSGPFAWIAPCTRCECHGGDDDDEEYLVHTGLNRILLVGSKRGERGQECSSKQVSEVTHPTGQLVQAFDRRCFPSQNETGLISVRQS